jgi:branched-chain amino acid transport system substrate-binding protein
MMDIVKHNVYRLFFIVFLTTYACSTLATNEIKVGMTAALSGLSAGLGQQIKSGLELGFSEINASGGIKGKKIIFIALDDGYKPLKAASNMRDLINKKSVLAVLGNTGTPTAVLTAPIANKYQVLMFGAYTGAGILRNEQSGCCVYNYRASYSQETAMMVKHILNQGIKPSEIAFFTQNDAFGDDGYKGAIEALKRKGYEQADNLLHTRYRRNTTNIELAASKILTAKIQPKAIIMVGSYSASSSFIKTLSPVRPDIQYFNISFTGSSHLLSNLGKYSEGVYITEVVPSINSDDVISSRYRAALAKWQPSSTANVISLEGYIVALLFSEALRVIDGEISRDTILNAFNNLSAEKIDLCYGEPCFTKDKKQASQQVWLTKVIDGKFTSVNVNISD